MSVTNSPKRPAIARAGYVKWILASLLIGFCLILLWPGFSMHEADIFVPITIGNVPAGLTVAAPHLKGLEIRMSGPKSVLQTLQDMKLKYVLNLTDEKVGVQSVPIDTQQIPLPTGVTIIASAPSFLTLRIEKEIQKELPVAISFSGEPTAGFFIAGAVAMPATITVSGPESVLSSLTTVVTKPINLQERTEPFKKEITLELAEGLKVISSSGIIMVDVLVKEKMTTRKFKALPVQGKGTQYRFSITPATLDIEVKGSVRILEKLNSEKDIRVYVELKGLKPGIYVRRAVITLPVKTILLGVKPEVFTVKIVTR